MAGAHERRKGPRGLSRSSGGVHITMLATRIAMLTPAAVGPLLGDEKGARSGNRGVFGRAASGHQAGYAEPGSVREADAPASFEAPVGPLLLSQESNTARHRGVGRARSEAAAARVREGLNASACALDIRIVDHDIAEDLRGVQELEPRATALFLVRRPAAVLVLPGENQLDGVFEQAPRDGLAGDLAEREGALEALRRAIGDGPPVRAVRKRPAAFRSVSVMALGARKVVENLIVPKIPVRPLDHRARRRASRGRPGGERGLDREGRVPEPAVIVPLHFCTVMAHPHVLVASAERAPKVAPPRLAEVVNERVKDFVDRPDINEIRGAILITDVLDYLGHGEAPQPGEAELLESVLRAMDDA